MRRCILFVAIISAALPSLSQIQFSTIGEVLDYAGKNSTVARQAVLQRSISEQEEGITRTGLLPRLNAIGTMEYAPILATQVIPESVFGGQDGKFRQVQFGMPWTMSAGVELSIPLINPEKWAQLQRARYQTMETSWSYKARLEDLYIQIAQWYYQTLLAKEMIRLNAQHAQVLNELVRILDERKRNGVLDPADYNRSKNLQLNVQTARQDYQKAWEQGIIMLRSLLNIPSTQTFEIRDSITFFNWPLRERPVSDVTQRPAWQQSNARIDVARQSLLETKKAALPKLSLSSRYVYNWQLNDAESIHFDVSTIGLKVDYTLFNGGFHRRQAKKFDLLLKSASLEQQQTQSTLLQQQQEWAANYQMAVSKKSVLKEKVIAAADNLRIARLNIKEGVMEFDTFSNIFTEYTNAQIEELQNLTNGIVFIFLLTNNVQ